MIYDEFTLNTLFFGGQDVSSYGFLADECKEYCVYPPGELLYLLKTKYKLKNIVVLKS